MILIVGASGATGRLLVEQLINRGESVTAIVRSESNLPEVIEMHKNLRLIRANISELSDTELDDYVKGCDVIISCLGHNLSFKGLYGHPRRLVTNAVRRLCIAVCNHKPIKPVKFILMNTTGNSNRDLNEKISFSQKCVILLLRLLLPPHVDNEKAADYLRINIGQKNKDIEWVVVRPDGLVDNDDVSEYEEYPSPIRSAIFDAGVTSRINVAHFFSELVCNKNIWDRWVGQMPVIYNKD